MRPNLRHTAAPHPYHPTTIRANLGPNLVGLFVDMNGKQFTLLNEIAKKGRVRAPKSSARILPTGNYSAESTASGITSKRVVNV